MNFDRVEKATKSARRVLKIILDNDETFASRFCNDIRHSRKELRAALSDLRFQAEVDAIRPRPPLTVAQTEEFCRLVREGKVQA